MGKFCADERFKTKAAFSRYFSTKIVPLRIKISTMCIGEIPHTDFNEAIFVYKHGTDAAHYEYMRRYVLAPYEQDKLDKYVDLKSL